MGGKKEDILIFTRVTVSAGQSRQLRNESRKDEDSSWKRQRNDGEVEREMWKIHRDIEGVVWSQTRAIKIIAIKYVVRENMRGVTEKMWSIGETMRNDRKSWERNIKFEGGPSQISELSERWIFARVCKTGSSERSEAGGVTKGLNKRWDDY